MSLTTADAVRLGSFYQRAFGFRPLAAERLAGRDFEQLMGVSGGAQRTVLGLGQESIELLQFDLPGRAYPQDSAASDLLFQHFAIVVSDITGAFERLRTLDGWSAITHAGPQRLPASAGGVTAYKFRDPEGHPLELLAFPTASIPPRWRTSSAQGPCVGIDHSAICVADSARSIAFYAALGLTRSGQSINSGTEQQRLDGVIEPRVEVTTLAPQVPTPHVELLCYRSVRYGAVEALRSNDIAATRLVFDSGAVTRGAQMPAARRVLDPDHHQLLIA
ncbi:MAG: VOC family protein [Steroidobacteraceae bacterium]